MDGSIVPILAFVTLGLVCVWGYFSAVKTYSRFKDPNDPGSNLSKDTPRRDLMPPDMPGNQRR